MEQEGRRTEERRQSLEQREGCKIQIEYLKDGVALNSEKIKHLEASTYEQGELLAKFDTIIEYMVVDKAENKLDKAEQKVINHKTLETLGAMNSNLTLLNSDNGLIKAKMTLIERTQHDQDNKTKLDWTVLVTKALQTLVVAGVLAGVVWLIKVVILN